MNGIAPGTPGHGPHGSCSAWSAGGSEPARSGAREAPRPGRAARRGRPRRAGLARARLAYAPRYRAAARGAAGAVVGAARLRRRVHDRGGARFLGAGAHARGGRGVRLLVGRAPEPAGRQSRRLGRVLGRAPARARGTPRAAGRSPVGGAGSAGAPGGFAWLLRLRLIPIVPFNLLNFASGLTALPWRTYAAATAIGVIPATLVYTFFADALLSGSREAGHRVFVRVLIAGALLVLLSFVPTIARKLGFTVQPSDRPTVPP